MLRIVSVRYNFRWAETSASRVGIVGCLYTCFGQAKEVCQAASKGTLMGNRMMITAFEVLVYRKSHKKSYYRSRILLLENGYVQYRVVFGGVGQFTGRSVAI